MPAMLIFLSIALLCFTVAGAAYLLGEAKKKGGAEARALRGQLQRRNSTILKIEREAQLGAGLNSDIFLNNIQSYIMDLRDSETNL